VLQLSLYTHCKLHVKIFPILTYLTDDINTLTFLVRAKPYMVSSQPLTTKARVQFQTTSCRNDGERNGTATGFSSEKSVFPASIYHSSISADIIPSQQLKYSLYNKQKASNSADIFSLCLSCNSQNKETQNAVLTLRELLSFQIILNMEYTHTHTYIYIYIYIYVKTLMLLVGKLSVHNFSVQPQTNTPLCKMRSFFILQPTWAKNLTDLSFLWPHTFYHGIVKL
jgi:hypothetical protein